MVDIFPFRALRFHPQETDNDISPYLCPPYDVISQTEREALIQKSPLNVVQLELPEGEGDAKYENAKAILENWKDHQILEMDNEASFYLLETTYRLEDPFAPSKEMKRTGVLAALRLEPPGKGAIRPHERTLPKAKEDRLKLLTAVETKISPVFGLFFDSRRQWEKWVLETLKKKPLVTGSERKDLKHRLWKVDDPLLQNKLKTLLKSKDIYIADGHHRYEVSWAYREMRLQKVPGASRFEGWNYGMAYLCPMEESGLLMLPTHRLVKSNKTPEKWRTHLEMFFSLRPVKNTQALIKILKNSSFRNRMIGWISADGLFALSLKRGVSLNERLSTRPKVMRTLDVVLLHEVVLAEAEGGGNLSQKEVEYTRDVNDMISRIKRDPSWVGFLLRAPGVHTLASVAGAAEVMPPKTTYFYPKVPTGFTMMPLGQEIK